MLRFFASITDAIRPITDAAEATDPFIASLSSAER